MDTHLTKPHDQRINEFVRKTPPGMAQWSGSGPEGATCLGCSHAIYNGHKVGGDIKKIGCQKYKSMMGHVKTFDPRQESCRFHDQAEVALKPFLKK